MKLTGKKVILRFPTIDDVDSITKYAGNPNISKYTFMPYPYNTRDAIEFIETSAAERSDYTSFHVAICDLLTDEVIGMIGLNTINHTHRHAEVGYWIAEEYWGTGMMLEAINLMVSYYFNSMKLERIYAYIIPDNIPSWKLLEKAGFEREGLLKGLMRKEGKRYDHYIYARLKK